ncbi:MAG: phosphatidylcholine/phosphatidylserine synthase [Acidobacteriales bacterium]|nr:phosphatidylcholine/phosphatidylserine synthase [Terriglobales bacterium]
MSNQMDEPVTDPLKTPLRRWDDEPLRKRRLRKGMYLLPSLFTAANIAAGYYAILQAMQGTMTEFWHFDHAAKAIGIAVLADGLDGRIARMTKTTSDFGRELDSLADVITFGVAPAVLAWMWGFRFLPENISSTLLAAWTDMEGTEIRQRLIQFGVVLSFVMLTAGASRLARFNIQKNPQPSNPGRPGRKYFVGMPIPAAAGVVAAVVHFSGGQPVTHWWVSAIWGALLLAIAYLMVSTWRFYSFKDIDLRSRHPFWMMILITGLFAAIWFFSRPVLFLIAMTYMLSGVIARLAFILRRKGGTPPQTVEGFS